MIYRHSKEEIDAYYQSVAMNQSSLKAIARDGMETFLAYQNHLIATEEERYYEEKEHFLVGSAVDNFISFGEEYYNDNYHFSRLEKKPQKAALAIVHRVFDQVKSTTTETKEPILEFDYYKELIYNACNDEEYFMNRRKATFSEDNRYTEILKKHNGAAYWQELIEARGKIILSDSQNNLINRITNSWLYHKNTAKFFEDAPDVDIIYQLPVYFQLGNVYCKVLIDKVYIDHKQKVIYLFDLKTVGQLVTKFPDEVYRRRYDIQGSFYTVGFSVAGRELVGSITGKDVRQYELKKFAFIVESTVTPGTPLICPMSHNLLAIGRNGSHEMNLLGWSDALNIYEEWSKADFDISKVAYLGIAPLTCNGSRFKFENNLL